MFFGDAFSIFLLRQIFLRGIPDELTDAARVNSQAAFGVVVRIIVPLAKPALVAVSLFTLVYTWNDFFTPLVYSGSNQHAWTLTVGLSQFTSLRQYERFVSGPGADLLTVSSGLPAGAQRVLRRLNERSLFAVLLARRTTHARRTATPHRSVTADHHPGAGQSPGRRLWSPTSGPCRRGAAPRPRSTRCGRATAGWPRRSR